MADTFFNFDYVIEVIEKRIRDRPVERRLFEVEEAANYLGLTVDALRSKVYSGKVPVVKLDSRMRFDRYDLDKMIDAAKHSVRGIGL